jgi:hypothetical protein
VKSYVSLGGTTYSNLGGPLLFEANDNTVMIRVLNLTTADVLTDDTDIDFITYCFTSTFPSLQIGTNKNIYKIEVTKNGDIQDKGFVADTDLVCES